MVRMADGESARCDRATVEYANAVFVQWAVLGLAFLLGGCGGTAATASTVDREGNGPYVTQALEVLVRLQSERAGFIADGWWDSQSAGYSAGHGYVGARDAYNRWAVQLFSELGTFGSEPGGPPDVVAQKIEHLSSYRELARVASAATLAYQRSVNDWAGGPPDAGAPCSLIEAAPSYRGDCAPGMDAADCDALRNYLVRDTASVLFGYYYATSAQRFEIRSRMAELLWPDWELIKEYCKS